MSETGVVVGGGVDGLPVAVLRTGNQRQGNRGENSRESERHRSRSSGYEGDERFARRCCFA